MSVLSLGQLRTAEVVREHLSPSFPLFPGFGLGRDVLDN